MQLDDVFRDFRCAVRSLWKDKRFAAAAVFALALGIGASTVVFSVFYSLMFNAVAAKDAGRLVVPVVMSGLVACVLPARRAARVDPLVALRYE